MHNRVRIRGEFLAVQRVYWTAAHNLLTALGRAYDARAGDGCMRLNVDAEQAEVLLNGLPAGAVEPSTPEAMAADVFRGVL